MHSSYSDWLSPPFIERLAALVRKTLGVATVKIQLDVQQEGSGQKRELLGGDGPERLRPLACVPLHSREARVGELCVYDEYSQLDTSAITLLEYYAGLIEERLECGREAQEQAATLVAYKSFFSASSDSVAWLDPQLRLLAVNPTIEQSSGLEAAQIIGKNQRELGTPEVILSQLSGWETMVRKVFSTGKSDSGTFFIDSPQGQRYYYQNLAVPKFDSTGRVVAVLSASRELSQPLAQDWQVHWVGLREELFEEIAAHRHTQEQLEELNVELEERVSNRTQQLEEINCELLTEIAERRRVEAELRNASLAAEEATRAKSDFLAVVSHELRTPMNGIIGMVDLLLTTPLNSEQREFAEIVRHCGDTMMLLVSNLLDFSKIELGKVTLNCSEFVLPQFLGSVVKSFSSQAAAGGLALTCEVSPNLPETVVADFQRLAQTLNNILANAIKFTERGRVSVRAWFFEPRLRIEVEDTGIGIPAALQAQLFQPFAQGDSSHARRYEGTGLGLAIARQLVELMGGEIGVESAVGAGSTFWFEVPVTVVSTPQEASAAHIFVGLTQRNPILVVEDNAVNCQVVFRQLARLGLRAEAASNGREALEMFTSHLYDLVLMDCQMPEMDGFQAAQELRRREVPGRRTPIVALTANANEGIRERCLKSGMDDCLTKPASQVQLAATLARWLEPEHLADV